MKKIEDACMSRAQGLSQHGFQCRYGGVQPIAEQVVKEDRMCRSLT